MAPVSNHGQELEDIDNPPFSKEIDRVQKAYEKRIDRSLYTFFQPAQTLMIHQLEEKLLRLLKRHSFVSLEGKNLLEIGCGNGLWLLEFVRWGANPTSVYGVDLLKKRIEQAQRICPPGIVLQCKDATQLNFRDGSFDLVFQFTVFTSILDMEMKRQIANEMLRLVANDGVIVWYDFRINNPRNRDVQGVGKKEIFDLFPNCDIKLERLTLAPPIGRQVAKLSTSLYRMLSVIKPLCTHYIGLISKKHERSGSNQNSLSPR